MYNYTHKPVDYTIFKALLRPLSVCRLLYDCRLPGCARDDLHRFRLPDDVPQALRLQRREHQPARGGVRRPVGVHRARRHPPHSARTRQVPRHCRRVSDPDGRGRIQQNVKY